MHGFTYNADGEGIEHRGYAASEGDDFEPRAIGSGPYTHKGVTFAPTGRMGRYADGRLELIYEYESKVGEVIWVTKTGRVFPPSAMPGVLKPADWKPSDPSHFPGYKGRSAAADVESRGMPPSLMLYGGRRFYRTGNTHFMRRSPYEKVWEFLEGDANGPYDEGSVDHNWFWVNAKGQIFWSLQG